MKNIKMTESELRKVKDIALHNYLNNSNKGMTSDCFWSKCVIESVNSVLKLGIKIKYPEIAIKKD